MGQTAICFLRSLFYSGFAERGFMDSQVFILNEKRNVTLTAYLEDDSRNFGVRKASGGCYFPVGRAYCSDREADPVAQEYLRAGYHAFVLRYSVGWENAVWPNPLEDCDQAMELIAAHAKEWHLIPEKSRSSDFRQADIWQRAQRRWRSTVRLRRFWHIRSF